MERFKALFTEGLIGRMKTKNRLVMAPMVLNYADEGGLVTAKYAAHISRIARGGIGMMVLEASYIRGDGKGFANELGIHSDDVIPGLRHLADLAHTHGVVIGPQIFHAGRQTSSVVTGMQPIAPSPVPDPSTNEMPREMSVQDIFEVVESYARAAGRAKAAGCDFVELHGAHGYLITQFLSPFSNKRNDEYGGDLESRLRFLIEVFKAVRKTVGEDFPISVRLSADEMVPEGITPEDTVKIAMRLEELGADALSISAGNYASFGLGYMISPMAIPDGPLVPLAAKIRHNVAIPVIAVGKIRNPRFADEIVRAGRADFIALGRSILADADWPMKAEEGRPEQINHCIACNQACIGRLFQRQDVWCTVNPETAREEEFSKARHEIKKTVLVAGGGPAGMEAAKVAAERGHHVILCERRGRLGGQLVAASVPPHRPGWEELREYLEQEMDRLGIEVRLNTPATTELARDLRADMAVIAVGASPLRPRIPGIESKSVMASLDILEGRAIARGDVVVAGGGCTGAQTAEYLAARGHKVTVVEILDCIAEDAAPADRELLLSRLDDLGVRVLTRTRLLDISNDEITVESPDGKATIPANTIVLCTGMVSNDGIAEEMRAVVQKVVVVGDALQPRKATEAIAEAALSMLQ